MEFSLNTLMEFQPGKDSGPVDIPVEIVYEVERTTARVSGVWTQDDQGDFAVDSTNDLTVDQYVWALREAAEDYDSRCERYQAMEEDAAESRAELAREVQREELESRERQRGAK